MVLVEVVAESDARVAEQGKGSRVGNRDIPVVGAATHLDRGVIIESADIQHQTHVLVGANFEIDDIKAHNNTRRSLGKGLVRVDVLLRFP